MKILWTQLALRDVQRVWDYLLDARVSVAESVVVGIKKSVENLMYHPNMGRPGRIQGTRELVVIGTPYIVPYRIRGDSIQILAVVHTARRWPEVV